MSASDEFVILRPSMIVPRAAYEAVLRAEALGYTLRLDGPDVIVSGRRGTALDPSLVDALRRWKPHVRMLLAYTPPSDVPAVVAVVASEDTPPCPHCDTAQRPERLSADWWLCPCCGREFPTPRGDREVQP